MTGSGLSPERWLEEHGDALFRYALVRVGDRDLAEDLVQEALLAAWRGRDGYAGAAAERTWLIGILKRKVCDHFRSHPGEQECDADLDRFPTHEEEHLFRADGHWEIPVSRWGRNPAGSLEAEQVWAILQRCIRALPESLRDGFLLREIVGMGIEAVCEVLAVKQNHFYVLMHRCRLRLRECIDQYG